MPAIGGVHPRQSSNNVTEQRRRGRDDPYRESSDGSGPEAIGPVLGMT